MAHKTLFVIRHAQAVDLIDETDFERYLTPKGIKQSKAIAQWLHDMNLPVDYVTFSAALRTKQTALPLQSTFNLSTQNFVGDIDLYHATVSTYNKTIQAFDNAHTHCAIVGHNPTITDFCNSIVDDFWIDNVPKASIVAFDLKTDDWNKWKTAEKQFLFFKQPYKEWKVKY